MQIGACSPCLLEHAWRISRERQIEHLTSPFRRAFPCFLGKGARMPGYRHLSTDVPSGVTETLHVSAVRGWRRRKHPDHFRRAEERYNLFWKCMVETWSPVEETGQCSTPLLSVYSSNLDPLHGRIGRCVVRRQKELRSLGQAAFNAGLLRRSSSAERVLANLQLPASPVMADLRQGGGEVLLRSSLCGILVNGPSLREAQIWGTR